MKPLRKEYISQEVFDLYDDYAHNKIDRRVFIERLSVFAVGAVTLPALLSFISPDYETTQTVSKNDPTIESVFINYDSPKGGKSIKALYSKPANASGKLPGVIVVHENRGLNPYIEDVGRRTAKAGFLSLAPDALSPLGGYPGNDDEGRAMQRTMDRAKIQNDFVAAAHFLKAHPSSNGKLGAVGFCFGGYIVNYLAAVDSDLLSAGVPFYGTPASESLHKNIKAPLMIQLGELDKRVNATWPEYEKSLKANNVEYTMHMYEGANHGFHNDSTGRYDEQKAELAWQRTLAFFNEKLS